MRSVGWAVGCYAKIWHASCQCEHYFFGFGWQAKASHSVNNVTFDKALVIQSTLVQRKAPMESWVRVLKENSPCPDRRWKPLATFLGCCSSSSWCWYAWSLSRSYGSGTPCFLIILGKVWVEIAGLRLTDLLLRVAGTLHRVLEFQQQA